MNEDSFQLAVNDVSGKLLDASKVKEARKTELEIIDKYGVWKLITKKEAADRGLSPVALRWVNINKGDDTEEDYRSRVVVKEFR